MANQFQLMVLRAVGFKDLAREMANNIVAVGAPNQGTPASATDTTVAGDINALVGPTTNRLKLTRKEIPKPEDPDAMVNYIKQWRAQLRIRPILTDLAATIVDNFRLKGSPELEAWTFQQRVYSKLQRVALDLATIGWCVVYVSEDPKAPPTLTILHNVAIKRDVLGNEIVYLQLSDEAKAAVKLNSANYPSYWSTYMDDPAGINITRVYDTGGKLTQGGAYFITIEGDSEDTLPLAPVFPFLGSTVDGERISEQLGAFVDMVKHYLIHAKVGDKVGADARDGRPKPPSKERLNAVLNSLSVGFRSGALVTPADVDVEIKTLDKDPFDVVRKNQTATNSDLQRNIGVPPYDEASSEGAAMFMARSFLPATRFLRHGCIMDQLLKPLMADLAAQGRMPGAETARFLWSEDSVHDLGTKLNVVKFKQSTGAYSLQSLCEYMDPDYNLEAELEQKKTEQKSSDVIGNIYEVGQGNSDKTLEAENQAAKDALKQQKKQSETPALDSPTVTNPKTLKAAPKGQPGRPPK
jgi:hypothetical protein